jgi:hypothetical protein
MATEGHQQKGTIGRIFPDLQLVEHIRAKALSERPTMYATREKSSLGITTDLDYVRKRSLPLSSEILPMPMFFICGKSDGPSIACVEKKIEEGSF